MSEHRDTLEVVERLGRVVGPLGITNLVSAVMLGILYARADAPALDHHTEFWIRIWGITAMGWPIFHFGFASPLRRVVEKLEARIDALYSGERPSRPPTEAAKSEKS